MRAGLTGAPMAAADAEMAALGYALSGYDDVFRIRVGTYRVLYRVIGRRLVIIILKVGHRREIYRSMR